MRSYSMKTKLLCILHRAPPSHGAAKVGDLIASSKILNETFDCRFITIKSSNTISDIGKVNPKKIYYILELYLKVLFALVVFRPQKIYFTASIRGVALYRDLLISTLWKLYSLFVKTDIYYHYHTKGVDAYISGSILNKTLTCFFLRDINLVLLSPALKNDFDKVASYKTIKYLPNGVEDALEAHSFDQYVNDRYQKISPLNILYLSNMIKSKGYFHLLELAAKTKDQNYHFHFAGSWHTAEDETEFFDYIEQQGLSKKVTFHGFVSGEKKQHLFKIAHLFMFPTRYKNEAFPLSILESFSNGLPVIATDEASIPHIVSEDSGIVIKHASELFDALQRAEKELVNKEAANKCRQHYLREFSIDKFENNLLSIFTA